MMRGHVTAEEIKRAISGRISSGVYPPGKPLPSLRQLAEELGANRNTIQKACQSLIARGILEARVGRQAPVVRRVPEPGGIAEQFREQARAAIWEAMAGGMPRSLALSDLRALVDQVYGDARLRIRFLECNEYESAVMGREIARLIDIPVEWGLTNELVDSPHRLGEGHDLIVTTFHHLAEVRQALPPYVEKIVGVDTRLAPETLLGIARLTRRRLGLVCTLADTARMLQHIILSYQPGCQIELALIDEPDQVRRVAQTCDHLLVTYNCVELCEILAGRSADVVIEFRIDDQSITFLRERISILRRRIGG
jgi:DNA-binding transcriptional regulator YhcF (GntR family)